MSGENNSGQRPSLIGRLAPYARTIANIAERVPVVRRFGVSQLIIAERI